MAPVALLFACGARPPSEVLAIPPAQPQPVMHVRGEDVRMATGATEAGRIRQALGAHDAALCACFVNGDSFQGGGGGFVFVSWQIEASGGVSFTDFDAATLDPRALGCIRRELGNWQFPPATESVRVDAFPMVFTVDRNGSAVCPVIAEPRHTDPTPFLE